MEKQNVLNLDPEIHLPIEDAAVKASTTTTTANPVVVRDIVTIVLDPDLLHHTIATTIVHAEEIENTTMKVTKIQKANGADVMDVDFDFYLYFFSFQTLFHCHRLVSFLIHPNKFLFLTL